MLKRIISLLLALCLLPVMALAEPVQMEEIEALRAQIEEMYAQLAQKESALEAMVRLYKIQNGNRRLVFEQESWTLKNGNNMRLVPDVVRVKDDAPRKTELRWESSDPSVVWIDRNNGRAYAKAPGIAEITCWAFDDEDIFAIIMVEVIEPVKSIQPEQKEVLLYVRETEGETEYSSAKVGVTVNPENATNKALTWTSENENIVRVAEDGTLTAAGVGKTNVLIKANDVSGKQAKLTVKVVKGVENLALNHTEAEVTVGKKLRLEAVFAPKDAGHQKLEWHSSDESVATVTTKGVVFAEKPGTCTITATTTDGTEITAECIVTVVGR